MIILGIETSCDDTGVGIVDDTCTIRANVVASQLKDHAPYGGVVPEIAARAHLEVIDDVVTRALQEAEITLDEVDGIAATTGPGLIGGVMVGSMMGKAIAAVKKLPFMAVNHLEAHALTPRLTDQVPFPYLLLLASGGHCQLVLVRGVGEYQLLGRTVDDAVGECFDKCAKMLGLGYPGGPMVEEAAQRGDPQAFTLPRPMLGRDDCDFSFSGLKTAVRVLLQDKTLTPTLVSDMAASLQTAIADSIADRVKHAFAKVTTPISAFVVAGGVAANKVLCSRLKEVAMAEGVRFAAPPSQLCTDNGVMVAWAGLERLRLGFVNGLDIGTRPRWPLEEICNS